MRTSISLAWGVLLLCAHAAGAATVVTRTLREDGTGSYTNLAEWENARQRDLVAADEIERLVIEGTWSKPDTTLLGINGWNTDATHWIEITNSTSKHGGGWNDSAYRLDITNTVAPPIGLYEDYVRFYGLQVKLTATSGSPAMVNFGGGAGALRFEDCIFRGNLTGTADSDFFYDVTSGSLATLVNCVAYNSTNSKVRVAIGNVAAFNCTFANVYRATYYATSATNCIAQDCGTDCFGGTSGDYNCTDDATAPGANSVLSYEVPFVSETLGSEDYHLTSSATSVIGAGLDNPASGSTRDFEGQDRSDWDIGADEFVSTSGQVIIVVTE